jgi:hypothetical protein
LLRQGLNWLELDQQALLDALPFWAWIDVKRVQKSLQDLGLILIDPVTGRDDSGVSLEDAQGRALRAAVDGRTVAEGDEVELGIRPEHMHPDPAGYPVEVENIEQLGGESYLYVRTDTGVALTAHLSGQTSLTRGARTHLSIRPDFAHVFRKDGNALPRLRLGELAEAV